MNRSAHLVSPPSASDSIAAAAVVSETLAESIERVVRRRTGDKVHDLKVEVRRDGVRLQGRCPTYYCKQLAQHAAMLVTGETSLSNEIEVG